jgi:hypothetical protein
MGSQHAGPGTLSGRVLLGGAAGAVAGIRPWAPDYCTTPGICEPMSLFTPAGTAKPALAALQEGLRAAWMSDPSPSRGGGPGGSRSRLVSWRPANREDG